MSASNAIEKSKMELLTKGIIACIMFNTNIFNHLLDENIKNDNLPKNFNYFITHIQLDELNETKKEEIKNKLLKVFKEINKEEIPTESAIYGISRYDQAKYGDGDLYNKVLLKLQKLDKESGKKMTPENQAKDVLIAETCIKNNFILISNDENLRKVTLEFNGQSLNLEQFLKRV